MIRNDGVMGQYTADFRRLGNPAHAWGDVINTHLLIPQLRGFWPYSSVDESGNVYDLSGQGRTLANNGSTAFGQQLLVPYADFDGSNDYFSRTDEAGFDITTTITFGGWFYLNNLSSKMGLMGKWEATGNQQSYLLMLTDSPVGEIYARASMNGAAIAITSNFGTVAAQTWFHAVFTGSVQAGPVYEVEPYLNGSSTGNTSASGSSLHSGTADFRVGRFDSGNYLNGRAALCFLSAAQLSGDYIFGLYESSKQLFGVEA